MTPVRAEKHSFGVTVLVESRSHVIVEKEPAWSRLLEEITAFLKG